MIKIYDKEQKRFVTDESVLMTLAGLDFYMKFEAVGVQDDGTPVIFDRCGNFGYLNPKKFQAVLLFEAQH